MDTDTPTTAATISSRLNRAAPTGSAARSHGATMMLAPVERRQRAAEILADGLLKLLQVAGRTDHPSGEHCQPEPTPPSKRPQLRLVRQPEAEGTT